MSEVHKDDPHSRFEVPDVLTTVLDVPINRLRCNHLKARRSELMLEGSLAPRRASALRKA